MVTILIIEDDEMVRLLTKTHLALAHEHIDLLIVDIQMPKMNGYELMHSLRDSGDCVYKMNW